jgi:hypothetical protein
MNEEIINNEIAASDTYHKVGTFPLTYFPPPKVARILVDVTRNLPGRGVGNTAF